MKTQRFARLVVIVGMALGVRAADTQPLDLKQAYVKKATWAETMIATRANCAAWIAEAKPQEHQLAGTPLRVVWAAIAKDWPAQCAWFAKELPRNRHLDWFLHARDLSFERWLLSLVTKRLGQAAAVLDRELAELQRAKAGPDDPRWLGLCASANRFDEVVAVARNIWLRELREAFEERAAELLRAQAPYEDARWTALKQHAAQCADGSPAVHLGGLSDLRVAIDTLAAAMPGRFSGNALAKQFAEAEPKWNSVIAGVMKQDAKAIEQLPELYREVRAFRRGLLLAVRGMDGFLRTWARVGLEQEWEDQFASLQRDLGNRAHFDAVAPETFRKESLVLPGDRDPADIVLRRTAALMADLGKSAAFAARLDELQKASAVIAPANIEARYVLFADACRLRREIAFSNPLLSFNKLLFIKRHLAIYNHMCDQYYGITARPGGALCVLERPFRPDATVRDLLARSVVERGRLKGQKLSGGPKRDYKLHFDGLGNVSGEDIEVGSFLSPALSPDAKQIAFAYVERKGSPEQVFHEDPARGHWDARRCYHIFKVNVDGTGLQQLTDGTWNEFDPCWLPNGRIAFISERRGGYLRCGRACPLYTLYDMNPDGSGINCLSFHDSNEWHPSVSHDGRIVWTRWDYVDRHGCIAHMPWITTLDGRDPRPLHGNYAPRQARPDMELYVRPIPGSPKYVGLAAPHHGQAYGSIIIINPQVVDDDGMGPVRRFTPEVGFPESQGGKQAYSTPWPLSENYHLCVYDAAMTGASIKRPGGNYGIYLVDAFGNKELIYRDPDIGCMNPIPLRPMRLPAAPASALAEVRGRRAIRPGDQGEGTMAVINVYDNQRGWSAGTKITALRVFQLLPCAVPSGGLRPHETGKRVAEAGDSIVPCRWVVGTVPVEEDGSAHFTVPAYRELFFQALDERGMALNSMRSATHVRHGEKLVCQGCHEHKSQASKTPAALPLALRRAPSKPVPDVDGSNPFSYPRLVQPVLERNCVGCHDQNKDKNAPNLAREPITNKFYAPYNTRVKFGFPAYGDAYRTLNGKFGARASKLVKMLEEGHHDVKLSDEDFHRLTLWLDCMSMFYGVFEREPGEAQLRGEVARAILE
ncbi:MAG: hypothetical protein N2689_01975 [Verrucomicrobiae bacterium]|nr:hypothetical protein [Verrucomicrobiae bacterium]